MGTFNYNLASFSGEMVKKVTPIEFSCSDTFCFLEDLHKHAIKDKFTVSFDICSLFINIPLHETIDLAVDRIMKNDPSLKITRKELCELFEFATSKTNFIFQNVIYDQVDGISMGSPLAPTLANLFMGCNEQKCDWQSTANRHRIFISAMLMIFLQPSTMKTRLRNFSTI